MYNFSPYRQEKRGKLEKKLKEIKFHENYKRKDVRS